MKEYKGAEVIARFENETPLGDAPFFKSMAENQKRIYFESGRYATYATNDIANIPYRVGQKVEVEYQGPCVTII
ncbi:hypothetical protein [Acinetobacter sp.]|uniref:hypothetical protein n=1 Tax=Acinetobacter sp. TaxID=472 RepID=UPI0028A7C50C|nr:hypothetical protein [Acinetobacter sp.]